MKDDWDKYDFRQKTFDVHKDTKTIPIIYDEDIDKEIKKTRTLYILYKFVIRNRIKTIHETWRGSYNNEQY